MSTLLAFSSRPVPATALRSGLGEDRRRGEQTQSQCKPLIKEHVFFQPVNFKLGYWEGTLAWPKETCIVQREYSVVTNIASLALHSDFLLIVHSFALITVQWFLFWLTSWKVSNDAPGAAILTAGSQCVCDGRVLTIQCLLLWRLDRYPRKEPSTLRIWENLQAASTHKHTHTNMHARSHTQTDTHTRSIHCSG